MSHEKAMKKNPESCNACRITSSRHARTSVKRNPILLIAVLMFCNYCSLFCQKRDNNWLLQGGCSPYTRVKFQFTNGTVDTSSDFRRFGSFFTNTSISDSLGALLFYTNGSVIANANHDTLQNSSNFNYGFEATINCGQLATVQEAIFIPKPDDPNIYYLFHEVRDQFFAYSINQESPLNLKCSTIDLTLDSGLGGIVPGKKGTIVINDTMSNGLITACKHGNGRDWWLIAPRFRSNTYYKLLISTDSSFQFTTQTIGDSIIYATLGQANFSPDGNYYALVDNVNNLNVFKFDRCTGEFYDSTYINVPNPNSSSAYHTVGLAFSSNSRFLYVNTFSTIYQYDLFNSNIASSQTLVAQWDTAYIPTATNFLNAQLAPDNKIYIGTFGGVYVMHYINSPDNPGVSCDVVQNSPYIGTNLVGNASVPTFPNYKLGRLPGSPCDTLTGSPEVPAARISFTLSPNPSNGNFSWKYSGTITEMAELKIVDMNNKAVYRETLSTKTYPGGELHLNLSNGVYMCILTIGSKIYLQKLAISSQ